MEEQQEKADAHLENHFKSIQAIADQTTLPQMLGQLRQFVFQSADVETLTSRLR